MPVLFDHVTPVGVARCLQGHKVVKAKERGWDALTNGDLLSVAEAAGFDLLLTADKNMRYQQNLEGRRIALVVLSTPQWPVVQLNLGKIAVAVSAATPESYLIAFAGPDGEPRLTAVISSSQHGSPLFSGESHS